MPALEGAVAGSDDDDVAVGVREHLRFNVARPVQVALHEAFAPAEGGHGFTHGRVEGLLDLVHLRGPPSARGRLRRKLP